jgi:hypothetical protein
MKRLGTLLTFVWEFVVGDDWTIALGVVGALGVTALLAELGSAWFVMPVAVVGLLGFSVWRAVKLTAGDRATTSGMRTSFTGHAGSDRLVR